METPMNSPDLCPRAPQKKSAGRIQHLLKLTLLAAALGFASVAPSQAQTPNPAYERHVGKVVFQELITPDLASSKRFYGELLGWEFKDMRLDNGTRYAEASLQGEIVGGMIHRDMPAGERRQPAWLTFISARDVDAAKATAVTQGARVLLAPRDVPLRGREAIFADPQGAVFAVVATSRGDTPERLAAPGEWIWSSLITTDPDTDAAFYQSLFDYEVFDLAPSSPGAQHLMFASGDFLRASANTPPVSNPGIHPHWINFIRVIDTSVIAANVLKLGGKVLAGPYTDRHGGQVAIVADPQGAIFGLMEWPEGDSKGVGK
jgi:predicted enzyme related to lactoylglutathione lyase